MRWTDHLARQYLVAADNIPAWMALFSFVNIVTFAILGIALGAFFRLVRFVVRRANRVRHPSR